MDIAKLDEAMTRLSGWRGAGESYTRRGGSTLPLDVMVDIALDEIEWRKDPEGAEEDEVERPDGKDVSWALKGMEKHFGEGQLGEDLQAICKYLSEFNLSVV